MLYPLTAPGGPGREVPYQVDITGDIDGELRQILLRTSDLVGLRDRPPATRGQLERRVREDRDQLLEALRSRGYYAGGIDWRIDYDKEPARVVVEVDAGPPFIISDLKFHNLQPDPAAEVTLPEPSHFGLRTGTRIKSAEVVGAKEKIRNFLAAEGYPFATVSIHDVRIDHADYSASIEYHFDPGPLARFGDLEITGLERLDQEYIRQRIPWQPGDRFSRPLIDKLRRDLAGEGLFSLVRITHAETLDEEGRLPIKIDARERHRRSFRIGAGYETDIGPQLRIGWLHRNFRGRGEKLNIDFAVSETKASLTGGYIVPYYRSPRNTLKFNTGLRYENTDAYESGSFFVQPSLERRITSELALGWGVGYRIVSLRTQSERQELGLLFFPFDVIWDSRDNLLDPRRGIRFNLRLSPFVDTFDPATVFLKTHTVLSNYLQIGGSERVILASRGVIGTIGAEDIDKVPLDERFFAGGGGSIRGYAQQSVGPRLEGVPVGGLSKLELGSEMRLRISRRSGMVVFLDGGQVFESSYPDFSEQFYWGCGLGYRFFSDFGPVRLDLAFPLNRRSGIDDLFYLYVSIGQAF